jgi:hypothetical protein
VGDERDEIGTADQTNVRKLLGSRGARKSISDGLLRVDLDLDLGAGDSSRARRLIAQDALDRRNRIGASQQRERRRRAGWGWPTAPGDDAGAQQEASVK